MVTPVWRIQRELDYAKARDAYYLNKKPSENAPVPRSTQGVFYRSLLVKIGTTQPVIKLQASAKAIVFFGDEAALGLVTVAAEQGTAIPKPKGFRPSIVKAMEGATTPTAQKAFGNTGRRYIKYSKATDGTAQAHYQAPISEATTPTIDGVQAKFAAIKTAKAAALGDYGRLYLELETFSQSGF